MHKVVTVASTAAATVAAALVPLAAAAPASAAAGGIGTTTYDAPGTYTYTVPLGLGEVSVTAGGGAGQTPANSNAGTGGPGAIVTGSLAVTPGSMITVTIGSAGGFGPLDGGYGLSFGGNGGAGVSVATNPDDAAAGGTVIAGGGGGGGGAAGSGVGPAGAGGAGGAVGVTGAPGAVKGGGGGGGATTSPGAGGAGGVCDLAGTRGGDGQGGNGGEGVDGPNGNGGGGGGGGSSTFSTTVQDPSICTGCNTGNAFVTIAGGLSSNEIFQQINTPGTPSAGCQAEGGTPLLDTTNEGVRTYAYVYKPSATNADVCFRIASPQGSFGGMLAVTPVPPGVSVGGIGLPTIPPPTLGTPTTDNHSSYCASPPPGSAPNQIVGQHPVSSGTLPNGATWSVDLYTDALTTTWVCLHAGTVDVRVVVPDALPNVALPTIGQPSVTITPGIDVTYYPDAGNL